ncbi:MAG: hypothetical protein D3908_05395, partial [Candidatus Electrothrix sp. AUS4]|nr:hypothetical protein [Candidatus Electrothrix sp. AUS4]
ETTYKKQTYLDACAGFDRIPEVQKNARNMYENVQELKNSVEVLKKEYEGVLERKGEPDQDIIYLVNQWQGGNYTDASTGLERLSEIQGRVSQMSDDRKKLRAAIDSLSAEYGELFGREGELDQDIKYLKDQYKKERYLAASAGLERFPDVEGKAAKMYNEWRQLGNSINSLKMKYKVILGHNGDFDRDIEFLITKYNGGDYLDAQEGLDSLMSIEQNAEIVMQVYCDIQQMKKQIIPNSRVRKIFSALEARSDRYLYEGAKEVLDLIKSKDKTVPFTALLNNDVQLRCKATNRFEINIDSHWKGSFWQHRVNKFLFSSDGKTMISAGDHSLPIGPLCLWDVERGKLLHQFDCKSTVWRSAISPNEKTLLSYDYDKKIIQLWNTDTRVCIRTIHADNSIMSLSFSPDGKLLATGAIGLSGKKERTIQLWKVGRKSLRCIHKIRGHTDTTYSVSFSPDGKTLASGGMGKERNLCLWKVSGGRCIRTLDESQLVWSVSFSPDGSKLAAGMQGGTVRLWETNTGNCLNV